MDKLIHLKIASALLSGGLAFAAFANVNNTTVAPSTDPATAVQSPQSNQTEGMKSNNTQSTTMHLSDDALLSAVESSLGAYKDKVSIKVTNGIVYLSGQLPSDTDYENVVTLVESTRGIGNVNVDNLTVKDSKAPLQDSWITAKVKAALIQADIMGKDLPSWTVGVETKNGQVFLSGQVASAQEKQAILNVVKSVKGVSKVDDQMQISANAVDNNNNTMNDNATTNDAAQTTGY
ncbi:BON domain-containing protein [Legionella clemsonensis]|uniref:Osmotically-inducible protein Y n=1 Tax=Legionella clemsonensis TaxID=1867846 RepID=A0A222NYV5_9GAMM|nr:BON domain-containing protein [Legionella clemsonensis]ASQ44780.1 Osmotically-inducible protein Y precursor [Legionella clemsonensis]